MPAPLLSANQSPLSPSEQPWELVAAHRVTHDPRYLLALLQTAQFGLGANPTNTSYTTGHGSRTVVPFHLDALYLGENWPWAEAILTSGEAIFNEHTIAGSLANMLLLRGYLAQELSR